jgi:surfactin synthase thioesterase subunit
MNVFGFSDKRDSLLMRERWAERFPAWIGFVPVNASLLLPLQEPGGSDSSDEAPTAELDELAKYVAELIDPREPYAFIGYREGCRIAHRLAASMVQAGASAPSHLLLAGANPPHVSDLGFGRQGEGWMPLPCRLSILSGRQDKEVPPGRLSEWSRYAQGRCDIHSLAGGPAVWSEQPEELIQSCMIILEREYAQRAGQ